MTSEVKMIDRVCPRCSGRAVVTIFENERGMFCKLWKCEGCPAVWGIPLWNPTAHDLPYDMGMVPWVERESRYGSARSLSLTSQEDRRPVLIALLVIVVAIAVLVT
jgi:hypothetical protein